MKMYFRSFTRIYKDITPKIYFYIQPHNVIFIKEFDTDVCKPNKSIGVGIHLIELNFSHSFVYTICIISLLSQPVDTRSQKGNITFRVYFICIYVTCVIK